MSLKKDLTAFGVFSLGAGAMISSGLFVLPSLAYEEAGSGVLISYALAGLMMVPAIFSKLELTSAIPKSGGAYFYLTRILGVPTGLVSGFADWFSIALKSAFALVGIGVFASVIFPYFGPWEFKMIAVGACLFFTIINLISVKSTGIAQSLLVILLLAILLEIIFVGYRKMDFTHFERMAGLDWRAVLATTGMVFISFGGITKVSSVAEEMKDAKHTLIKGMLSAFFVVQALYLLIIATMIGVLPHSALTASRLPVSDTAAAIFENPAVSEVHLLLAALAGLAAFFTTANAGILSASRVPMAMSRDRLIPPVFHRLSRKGIPYVAILVTSAFMLFLILALDIKNLAKVASLFLLMVFLLENLAVIIVRRARLSFYRPSYKTPLYPLPQIFGIAMYALLITTMGFLPLVLAGGFVAAVLIWYFIYARKKVRMTSALVRMMKGISESAFQTEEGNIEDELYQILLERDEIEEDRFDRLIKKGLIFDYGETIDRDRLFKDASKAMAERWNLDSAMVLERLVYREEQTSTIIYPGVALPHALPHGIVDGTEIFDIAIVRNKYGIKWNDKGDIVYTAFLMIGSKDQRHFHLKALMSIAQILQDPQFHSAWHKARKEEDLRAAVIFTKRKREKAEDYP